MGLDLGNDRRFGAREKVNSIVGRSGCELLPLRKAVAIAALLLAACHEDWRGKAITDAEDVVRKTIGQSSLQFSKVQFTGDANSGQTCGYFVTKAADGSQKRTRFIAFIDGNSGQNPYVDDWSSPFPDNKNDFELNWRTQCLELGYRD